MSETRIKIDSEPIGNDCIRVLERYVRVRIYKILEVRGKPFVVYTNSRTGKHRRKFFKAGDTILDQELRPKFIRPSGVKVKRVNVEDKVANLRAP